MTNVAVAALELTVNNVKLDQKLKASEAKLATFEKQAKSAEKRTQLLSQKQRELGYTSKNLEKKLAGAQRRLRKLSLASDKSAKSLDKHSKSSVHAAKNTRTFGKSLDSATKSAALVDGPLGGVSSRVSNLNALVKSGVGPWLALGVAIAGASFLLSSSVREYAQVETQQLRTQALLKATGNASGLTAAQLDNQARSLARATLASTEGVRNAQNILLTFRSVQGATFTQAIKLSQDLADVMGVNIKQAALQLGKALEDPVEGVRALRRSGVSFTAGQRDMLRQMVATGEGAEAQAVILARLAGQIGGSAEGAGGGLAGRVDLLAHEWSELQEVIASAGAAGIASTYIGHLAGGIARLREQINPLGTEMGKSLRLDNLVSEMSTFDGIIDGLEEKKARLNKHPIYNPGNSLDPQINQFKETKKLLLNEWMQLTADINAIKAHALLEEANAKKGADTTAQQLSDDAGQTTLGKLDVLYSTQLDKQKTAHKQRLAQIAKFTIDNEELEKRGYASLDQARADFVARENTHNDQRIAQLGAASQREAEQRLVKMASEEEATTKQNDKIVSLAQRRIDRIHEEYLKGEERTVKLEEERYKREEDAIALDKERLLTAGYTKAEIKAMFRLTDDEAERVHQQKLTKITQDEAAKRQKAEQDLFNAKATLFESSLRLVGAFAKEGSKAARIAFAAEKAVSLGRAVVAMNLAVAQANASAPPPINAPAIAQARIIGGLSIASIAASTIAGVAHAGHDNIPREGTYLLDKGEAVLQPAANKELRRFLANQGRSATGGGVTVIVNEAAGGNQLAVSSQQQPNGDWIVMVDERIRNIVENDIRRGRGLAAPIEQTYGLRRGGSAA